MLYFTLFVYLISSASGLLLMKNGAGGLALNFKDHLWSLAINPKMLLGMGLYVVSFIIFISLMPKFNLSYLYPLSAGLLYLIIIIASIAFLGEKITIIQTIGSLLILIGVVALNIK